jgi:hypothetical protein
MPQSEFWRWPVAALACVLMTGTVSAQDAANPAEEAYASATPADVADAPEKIGDRWPSELSDSAFADALREALQPTPSTGVKPLVRSTPSSAATWNRTSNSDGSASYSVNKPLATPWDASIGADISTAPPQPDVYEARQLPGTTSNAGAGSAWANVTVPHVATVEMRAEPANGYDKFGTKLERSLPIGKSLSVTAQSSFGVTELRPTAAPTGTPISPDAAARLFNTDNSLQLNVLATGTSLLAGTSTITGDPMTHNRVSAAQKVYGPLSVTGSIYDPGEATANMSITAGMNFAW